MAPASLLLILAGMLWLCLWRQRWRLLGLPAIGLGLLLVPVLADPPDMLVAPDGRTVAVRDATGVLRVSGSRAGAYTVEQLFDEEPGPPPEGTELRRGVRCDDVACLLTTKDGALVSHVLDAAAFPEDCRRAEIIVTPLAAPVDCGAKLVIDRARLDKFGAHAVRMARGGGGNPPTFDLRTDRSAFPRPWQGGGER
jgi:competence protein ComEC